MSDWKELRRRVGRNIHAIRTGQAMPLAKLARLSGLSAETIDRLELGKDEVNLWHLLQLGLALEVDAAVFLGRNG